MVQRASLNVSMLYDKTLTATQAGKNVGFKWDNSGACWVKKFNEAGIAGLTDQPRVHSDEVQGHLIDLVLRKLHSRWVR